ncbi:MAG TPA: anti-sigma factor [Pseudolysinimonas sp.]|jgi:anti-sigma-K factor RskA
MNPKPSKDLGINSGAYVLNALSDAENAQFELLLKDSEETRAEVTELADTAVELGLSVEQVEPPAGLRASILDKVAATPQLAPLPAAAVPDESDQHEIARPAGPAEERAQRRWYTRPVTTLVAAAAAVALIFGGGIGVNAVIQGQQASATASQINQIQAAADYQRSTVPVTTGGTATLIWAASLQRSAIVVQGIDRLPGGKTYELWYIDKTGATPAGTFDASGTSQSVVLTGAMKSGASVGVTVEPSGGSKSPTTKPIAVFATA